MKRGIVAEYADAPSLVRAIRAVRERGFTRIEAFSPFPIEAIDRALGARRSPLAVAAGLGGVFGAAAAYALQWWLVAYLYPIDLGGRPPHMPLPFVIITIEMGFLIGALAVFVAWVVASRLFKLWEPLFDVEGFESVTRDGFWLAIGSDDPQWSRSSVMEIVSATAPLRAHGFGGPR
jgi:hypothetical protein